MVEHTLTDNQLEDLLNGIAVKSGDVLINPPQREVDVIIKFIVPSDEDIEAAKSAINANLESALRGCPFLYDLYME